MTEIECLKNGDSRLKVLFIPCWYPALEDMDDVIGTFCREHARAAAILDNVAVLVSTRSWPRWFPFEWKKVKDHGVQTFYTYCGGDQLPRVAWPIWHLSLKLAIRRLIREWGMPDILHAQDEIAYHVIRAIGSHKIPIVMSQHASCFGQRQLSPLRFMQYQYAFKRVKRVLTSNLMAESDYEFYGLKAQVTWLPNTVDLSVFHTPRNEARESWLLHASNLRPVKRFKDVLRAFKLVQNVRPKAILQVAGDGPDRVICEQLAKKLLPLGSYRFHGQISKKMLANLMQRSMGFVLPSEFETFGCVLIEALACDCPVLTTNVGGIPAVVPKGNGLFVEVGNVNQIAEGMLRLLDRTNGIEMDRVGRETRERFSLEAIARLLHQIHLDATINN